MRHKKNENSNLEKKRKGILITGLMFASCFSLILLEWANFEAQAASTEFSYVDSIVEQEIVPISMIKAKLKPKKQNTTNALLEIVEKLTKEEEVIIMVDLPLEEEEIDEFELEGETIDDEERIFLIVEDKPEFPGGERALMKFLGDNLKYPSLAVDAGKEGTVSVQFIIGKDGAIENVQLSSSNGQTRLVGGGCDEEAIRVVKKMPNWKPGKQRGRAVKVQFTLPVSFRLN